MAKCSAKEVARNFFQSLAELGEKPSTGTQLVNDAADWFEGWVSESEWVNPSFDAVLAEIQKSI